MAVELWNDTKRPVFGLPLSFTKYRLTEEKFYIQTGILTIHEEEVRLYRILDVTMTQTLWQRFFNVGTVHVNSADKSTPVFHVESVKNPREVRELLSNQVETERERKHVTTREEFQSGEDMDLK